ncbi:MAG: hypothetical protein ABIK89_00815 [Planctomycetota bacterium]
MVFRAAVILALGFALGTTGCASRRTYKSAKLPGEFEAPPTQDVNSVLLSRLTPRYAANSHLIERGDLLEVTIDSGYGEEPSRKTPIWVEEDGTARIPIIGTVMLGSLALQDAGRMIAAEGVRRGAYVEPYPYVTVEMKEQRTNKVVVIGPVEEPGEVELPRASSHLLAALVAAGKLTDKAGPSIEIHRSARHGGAPDLLPPNAPHMANDSQAELTSYGQPVPQGPQTIFVNLAEVTPGQQEAYYLEDGDVVVVGERGPRKIHVMGLVQKAGEYDLPPDQDLHLLAALALAGGRTSQLADKVRIIRQLPGQAEPVHIKASVRKAKGSGPANLRLAAGDTIIVEETPVTFTLDLMRNFLRFGVSSSLPLF